MDHIRRFGPAILFATEGFESFNAVIRAQSVHSNHHAPSRDIGRGFASINRVRHLLSGGQFMLREKLPNGARSELLPFSDREKDWCTAGRLALTLCKAGVSRQNLIAKALGLDDFTGDIEPGAHLFNSLVHVLTVCTGSCVLDKLQNKPWAATKTASKLPTSITEPTRFRFNICRSVSINRDEKYSAGNFILASNPRAVDSLPMIGRVTEILQVHNSGAALQGKAEYVLLELFIVVGIADCYGLPLLKAQGWGLIPVSVRIPCISCPESFSNS